MTKQSFKKYTATTMAAAAAATAIVPVAASADSTSGFPDVSDTNDHKANIMELVERDVIQGYENGNFGPHDSITRGQVAVMLTNALDLKVPENIDKVLKDYSDIKSGDRYAEEIAAVTAAGIFKGNNGKFNRYDNISRQQMATALVEGFNLEDYDNGEKVDVDFTNISKDHQKNVQTIANLRITTQPQDYRGYDDVSRGQFSTFLVETLNLTEELVVKGAQINMSEVDLKGTLTFAINGESDSADLEKLIEAGYEIEFKSTEKVLVDGNDKAYTNSTGKIDASESDVDSLEYQVVISKDGETVAETDRVKVNIVDEANTITEIENFVVTKDGEELKAPQLAFGDDKIVFDAKVKTADGKDKMLSKIEGVDVKYSSEHPAILKFVENGKATVGYKGDTAVTVKVGDKEYTQTINVGEERAADAKKSSLEKDSVKFATNGNAKVNLGLKDQYGQSYELKGENQNEITADSEDANLNASVDTNDDGVAYVEITATSETKGEVVVKANGDVIGTIQVNAMDAGEAVSYELTVEDKELDLNKNETKTVTFNAFDENGLKVQAPELHTKDVDAGQEAKYVLNSSNTDVLEVVEGSNHKAEGIKLAENAKAGDTAEVYVSKKAGAFDDEVDGARVTFAVVDSTKILKDVTFTSVPAITENTTNLNLADYIKPVAADGQNNAVEVGYSVADADEVDVTNMADGQKELEANKVWIVALGEDGEKDVALGKVGFVGNPLDDSNLHVNSNGTGVNVNVADNGKALNVSAKQGDTDITGTLNVDISDAEGSYEFNAFQNIDVNIAKSNN